MSDGVLAPNTSRGAFYVCDMVTANVVGKIKSTVRDDASVSDKAELLSQIMREAKTVYDVGVFMDDQDRDFFTIEVDGLTVWFVRNEAARLTAMLPEDY
jgi:hypothetical protein